jgi:hypothetical protein
MHYFPPINKLYFYFDIFYICIFTSRHRKNLEEGDRKLLRIVSIFYFSTFNFIRLHIELPGE